MLICPLILTLSSGSCKGRWFGERWWCRKHQDRECRCTICLWCYWYNQVISATDCGLTQDLVVHVKGSKPSGSKSVVNNLRNTNKVDFIISVVLMLRKWFSLLCPWIWIWFLDIFYYFFKFKLETPWNPIVNCQSTLHLGNSFWKLPFSVKCFFFTTTFTLLVLEELCWKSLLLYNLPKGVCILLLRKQSPYNVKVSAWESFHFRVSVVLNRTFVDSDGRLC